MNIRLEGIIKTTSPLHCATSLRPNLRYDYEHGRPTFTQGVGMPLTGTVQKNILTPAALAPVRVPYFPSNDLRGRLRRQATNEVCEALNLRGERIALKVFEGMRSGNFSGRPDPTATTIEEVLEAGQHIFLGLFGGGPRLLPSKLITHDLDPVCEATLSLGHIPERYSSLAFMGAPQGMLEYVGIIRRDNVKQLYDLDRMMRYVDNAFTEINARQDQVALARRSRKDAKQAASQKDFDPNTMSKEDLAAHTDALKKSDLASMAAFEYVTTGLSLYLELGFSNEPTQAQVGLLLEALASLFNENALGGRIATGAGHFTGHVNLVVDGQNLGEVLVDDRGAHSARASFLLTELADPFIDAKNAVLSEITADDVARFFCEGQPATHTPTPPAKAA